MFLEKFSIFANDMLELIFFPSLPVYIPACQTTTLEKFTQYNRKSRTYVSLFKENIQYHTRK
jgi:hypothetical protein